MDSALNFLQTFSFLFHHLWAESISSVGTAAGRIVDDSFISHCMLLSDVQVRFVFSKQSLKHWEGIYGLLVWRFIWFRARQRGDGRSDGRACWGAFPPWMLPLVLWRQMQLQLSGSVPSLPLVMVLPSTRWCRNGKRPDCCDLEQVAETLTLKSRCVGGSVSKPAAVHSEPRLLHTLSSFSLPMRWKLHFEEDPLFTN